MSLLGAELGRTGLLGRFFIKTMFEKQLLLFYKFLNWEMPYSDLLSGTSLENNVSTIRFGTS